MIRAPVAECVVNINKQTSSEAVFSVTFQVSPALKMNRHCLIDYYFGFVVSGCNNLVKKTTTCKARENRHTSVFSRPETV